MPNNFSSILLVQVRPELLCDPKHAGKCSCRAVLPLIYLSLSPETIALVSEVISINSGDLVA